MRVVFMGTPAFAAVSLRGLLEASFRVVGVYCQPPRPAGRGMRSLPCPVQALAEEKGLPVFSPVTLRDAAAAEALSALEPDVIAVVSYGKLLPQAVLDIPPLGCVNVHPSLLPKYRGSSPIQAAVLAGDAETGVCTMFMDAGMDTGDVIFREKTEIGEFETSGALFDRLAARGAALLCETLRALEAGEPLPRVPQNPAEATYTRPLDKSLCPIDWSRGPRQIVKQICGLQPWPVATAELGGAVLRVFGAAYTGRRTALAPGSIVAAGREGVEIACGGGETLLLTEVQAPGKRRMQAGEYLRGHPLPIAADA